MKLGVAVDKVVLKQMVWSLERKIGDRIGDRTGTQLSFMHKH